MQKKVISVAMAVCLLLGIGIMTVGAMPETEPQTQQNQGQRPGGGRGGMPQMGEMPSGEFTPPEGFTLPEGFTPPQMEGEFTPPQRNESNVNTPALTPEAGEESVRENGQTTENSQAAAETQQENVPFGGQMPEGMGSFPGNMQNSRDTATEQETGFLGFVKTYSTPILSVVLLGLAFLFVIFYRRKNY